jgi:AmmeMemoRadiSam system protein B/AmmeMemoRadiSam system protein A
MAAVAGYERVRSCAVAGAFYPDAPGDLRRTVERLLDAARASHQEPDESPAPKALIVPHAGYVYSGAVAASAYVRVERARKTIRRVVLLGPSHRVGFTGLAVPSADAYASPLGPVPVDDLAIAKIAGFSQVRLLDTAHAQEHSLEVQVPFLQVVLDRFELVPIVVGDAAPDDVARVLDALWGGPETLIVISSDLSHYHPYEEATERDAATCHAIQTLDLDRITGQAACGCRPINGLLALARRRDLRVTLVDARNSGDTAGPRDRVVGYGAFIVEEGDGATLHDRVRRRLGDIARRAIRAGIATGTTPHVSTALLPPRLSAPRASFVTLEREGRLRGCIGSLLPHQPLAVDVSHNAYRSAFKDIRFTPLTEREFADTAVSISVLTVPVPLPAASEADVVARLRPGIDGLIIEDAGRRGTFLPQVWEHYPDPATFLRRLKAKAGLPEDHWSDALRLWRYTTETFATPAD